MGLAHRGPALSWQRSGSGPLLGVPRSPEGCPCPALPSFLQSKPPGAWPEGHLGRLPARGAPGSGRLFLDQSAEREGQPASHMMGGARS